MLSSSEELVQHFARYVFDFRAHVFEYARTSFFSRCLCFHTFSCSCIHFPSSRTRTSLDLFVGLSQQGGDLKHMRSTADYTFEENKADAMRLSAVFDTINYFPK